MECLKNKTCLATELCPAPDSLIEHFTQLIICSELVIPEQKPDIEYLSKEVLDVCLTKVEVIDVDLGDEVKRRKLIFQGSLGVGIEYSANMPEQEVHFAHFSIPFQGFIGERPCTTTNKGLITLADFDLGDYKIHYCIEHAQYHKIDSRKFKPVIVLLIWLEEVTP